jgi:hypothetical protein
VVEEEEADIDHLISTAVHPLLPNKDGTTLPLLLSMGTSIVVKLLNVARPSHE